jgi:hypothetical protein
MFNPIWKYATLERPPVTAVTRGDDDCPRGEKIKLRQHYFSVRRQEETSLKTPRSIPFNLRTYPLHFHIIYYKYSTLSI